MTPAAAIALVSIAGTASAAGGSGAARPPSIPIAEAPAGNAIDRTAPERESTDKPEFVAPVLHGLALMTVMRGVETVLWPDPFARPQYFGAHYEEAYSQPPKFEAGEPFMRWDGDPLVVNVLGHGLFGSELYLRARQCHLGWGGSLAFAAGSSAVWEYLFEANGVRPSAQDLVYTPLAGIVLGEARFAIHRLAGDFRSKATRGIVRALVDPLGELERGAGSGC